MIYFDSAASALPDEETIRFFAGSMAGDSANQESAHRLGYLLRGKIAAAAEQLSRAVTGEDNWQVIWCQSGTDAFNLFASCMEQGTSVITSKMEHPALAAAVKRIDPAHKKLSTDRTTGKIQPDDSKADAAVFHLVQSETGIIQDTVKLFEAYPDSLHFMDAVQAALKIKIPVKNVHIMTVSGNKFGAPGCAALLVSPHWKNAEKFLKRANEARHTGYLAGRLPAPAILTCAFAAEKRSRTLAHDIEHITHLNTILREGCMKIGVIPTLPQEYTSPWILHTTVPGHQGGVLVRMLSEEGVCVSSGSACASETQTPSPAMTALGFDKKEAFSGLRFSFDRTSTEEEVKKLLSSLEKVLKNY